MQTTAEDEGCVAMATASPSEVKSSKCQTAPMSVKASAFTIASLIADDDSPKCLPAVTTSNPATDTDCVSTSGTRDDRCRVVESPTSTSPQNCVVNSSTTLGTYVCRYCTVGRPKAEISSRFGTMPKFSGRRTGVELLFHAILHSP